MDTKEFYELLLHWVKSIDSRLENIEKQLKYNKYHENHDTYKLMKQLRETAKETNDYVMGNMDPVTEYLRTGDIRKWHNK